MKLDENFKKGTKQNRKKSKGKRWECKVGRKKKYEKTKGWRGNKGGKARLEVTKGEKQRREERKKEGEWRERNSHGNLAGWNHKESMNNE